jgi:hypothetical protein
MADIKGARYLVNKGSGDDVILKTGANYKTDSTLSTEAPYWVLDGLRLGTTDFVARQFLYVKDSELPVNQRQAIGWADYNSFSDTNSRLLAFGVDTVGGTNNWYMQFGDMFGGALVVPRQTENAVLMMFLKLDATVDQGNGENALVYCFINGVIQNQGGTPTLWNSSKAKNVTWGALRPNSSTNSNTLQNGYIGSNYVIPNVVRSTQEEYENLATLDYKFPEGSLKYEGAGNPLTSDIYSNEDLSVFTTTNNGWWMPMMDFSVADTAIQTNTNYDKINMVRGNGTQVFLPIVNIANVVQDNLCSLWVEEGLPYDIQRSLTALTVDGQLDDFTNLLPSNIIANTEQELSTQVFSQKVLEYPVSFSPFLAFVWNSVIPLKVDWGFSNKYYFNPDLGSNYTGLGTSLSPFGILDASIIRKILSNHNYALGVPEFTLQSGTYPMLELFEAGLDFSKGYQLSDAPDDLAKITTDVNNVTPVFSYGFELTGVQNLTIDGNSGLIIHQSEVGSYLTKNPNNDGRIVLGANYAAPDEASQNKNINFKNFSFLPIGEHDGSYPVSGWTSSADFLHRGDGGSKLKVAKCNPADTINFRGFARSCVIDNVTFWGGSTTVTTQSDVVAPAIVNSEIAYFHEDALKVGNPNTLVANVYIRDSLHINPLAHSDAIQSSYADNTGSILTNNKIIHTVDKPIGFVGEPQPLHGIYDIDGQKVLYNTYQDYINAGSPLYGYNYVDSEGFVRLYSTEEGVAHEGTDAYSMYVVTSSLQGIFLSTESLNDNVTVANNLVIPGNQAHGITGAYVNSTIVNNTVLGKIGADYASTHDNCIVANNIQTSIGAEANSVGATYANNAPTSSVTFVDSDPTDGTYDFSLVSNITGDATYAPVTDINGVTRSNPPSVGAYEYV